MSTIFDSALILVIFLPMHFLIYMGCFSTCFENDIDFGYGRKKWKNRKKNKDFWRKLFFLDVKDYIKKWHYVCFWINLISFIPLLVCMILNNMNQRPTERYIFLVLLAIYGGAAMLPSLSYWPLYRGNVIRSKRKYRRNRQKNR